MNQNLTPYELFSRVFPGRIKRPIPEQAVVRIDDQSSQDVLPSFCVIHARAEKSTSPIFHLELQNVPVNENVEDIAAELEGEWFEGTYGKHLNVSLSLKQLAELNKLAKAVRSVVGRGARYPDPNWRWMAPRTAASLEQFVRKVKEARRS